MLGKLKAGGVWRLGADTSTTFKTGIDLAFGDVTIPAGEYSIWMQREEGNSWKLLFEKQHGQWGEPAPDPAQCFASVPLVGSKPAASVDLVTLTLSKANGGGTLTIQWGTLPRGRQLQSKVGKRTAIRGARSGRRARATPVLGRYIETALT